MVPTKKIPIRSGKRPRSRQKRYFDKQAKSRPTLHSGDTVTYQKQTDGQWSTASIIAPAARPRSYHIETEAGTILQRNRKHVSNAQPSTPVQNRRSPVKCTGSDAVIPTVIPPALDLTRADETPFTASSDIPSLDRTALLRTTSSPSPPKEGVPVVIPVTKSRYRRQSKPPIKLNLWTYQKKSQKKRSWSLYIVYIIPGEKWAKRLLSSVC